MLRHHSHILIALVLNAVAFTHSVSAQSQKQTAEKSLSKNVEATLKWLPTDTEIVVVARSFKMPGSAELSIVGLKPTAAAAKMLQVHAMGPLLSLDKSKYVDLLAGKKIALALGAGRSFDVVSEFGSVRYQGCHVLIFEDDLAKTGDRLTELLRKDANAIHTVEGYKTYVFKSVVVKDSVFKDKDWEGVFVVRPQPNVLLVATQEAFLKEVLERRRLKPADRAFPKQLSVWKHVDRSASAWIIRLQHLTWRHTLGTPAYVVTLQPDKRNELEIVYLPVEKTSLKWPLRVATETWHMPGLDTLKTSTRIRQLANGVTIVNVSLDTKNKNPPFDLSTELIFPLMGTWK